MKKNKIELLAPAGNKEAFVGAINAGANAVYLAGKEFGARKYASNFTLDEIQDLIVYAHLRHVAVFVTVNTLVYDEEIQHFLDYTDVLVKAGVEALIVQDIGVMSLLVKRYPKTEIHASTQTNTYSIEQLKYLKSIGVSRVILARETSIESIRNMRQEVAIDLEVFVHGALCVSYSGNCYFSQQNGGRSGNRGECAQPCRLPYQLYRNNELRKETCYLLSTKDLYTFPHMEEIMDSGVVSLKIEGRMRRSEYVIHAVKTYREMIDHILSKKILSQKEKELSLMFNRSFTKGYLMNERSIDINYWTRPNHQGVEVGRVRSYEKGKAEIILTDQLSVGDGYRIVGQKDLGGRVDRILYNGKKVDQAEAGMVIQLDLMHEVSSNDKVHKTMDKKLDTIANSYIDEQFKLMDLQVDLQVKIGQKMHATIKLNQGNSIKVSSDFIVEQAKKSTQTSEDILNQFNRFGDSFYQIKEIHLDMDQGIFVPNKVIKNLRRDMIKALEEKVLQKDTLIHNVPLRVSKKAYMGPSFSVKVEEKEQLDFVRGKVDQVYLTESLWKHSMEKDFLYKNRISEQESLEDLVLVHDARLGYEGKRVIGSPYLNVTNHLTLASLINAGMEKVTLSFEQSVDQMIHIVQSFQERFGFRPNVEVVVYGKMDLMISKYCPIQKVEGTEKNCMLCERYKYALRNQSGESFTIKRDASCNVRILHHKAYNIMKDIPRLKAHGITQFASYFTDESKEQVEEIMNKVLEKIS